MHEGGFIMKKALSVVAMVAAVCFMASTALAIPDADLQGLATKAIAYYKANGKEKAVAAFNDPKGQFVKGDLYVVVIDYNGIVAAHGGTPALTGKSLYDQKDPNSGKYFVREMIDAAKSPTGTGWVSYSWMNPVSKKIQPKKSWIQRIENANSFAIVGTWQ